MINIVVRKIAVLIILFILAGVNIVPGINNDDVNEGIQDEDIENELYCNDRINNIVHDSSSCTICNNFELPSSTDNLDGENINPRENSEIIQNKIIKKITETNEFLNQKLSDSLITNNYSNYSKRLGNFLLSNNSTIVGYVSDSQTNLPIEGAEIILWWDYTSMYIKKFTTYTNESGFYNFDIPAGEGELIWIAYGYYVEFSPWFYLDENETVWMNTSLNTINFTSVICGYVKDKLTNDPIYNATIELSWENNDQYYFDLTFSDNTGYYEIGIIEGYYELYAYTQEYFQKYTYGQIEDNETAWINFSLYPKPPEDSVVCGYITDSTTGEPIGNATVNLYWRDELGHYLENSTKSCECCGFYTMNVAAGEIQLDVYAEGYFDEEIYWLDIDEDETLWLNIALVPYPVENSIIKGYITDTSSEEPIEDAYIYLRWRDEFGHYLYNSTDSDDQGFYQMSAATGEIRLSFHAYRHFDKYLDYQDLEENETLWVNISMTPYPPENSQVCGYITNSINGQPIQWADIFLWWQDEEGHSYYNETNSDLDGYYNMNIAEGEIQLDIYAYEYFSNYTNWYSIQENQTLWVNISMKPYPTENSAVCGYITDSVSGDPIHDVYVDVYWKDYEGHSKWNDTYSNSDGYYAINVAAGEIKLYVYADGYYGNYSDWYSIQENETLWVNMSMDPYPQENSLVCGYVIDSISGEPIDDADVNIDWEDDEGHSKWNDTYSNSDGYYAINVAAGEIKLYAYKNDYYSYITDWYEIEEDEIFWINISMEPYPQENSLVCGYIIDNISGEPINEAEVEVYWKDGEGHSNWNDTLTNSDGYYAMNVAAGIIRVNVHVEGYFSEHTDYLNIEENEILWVNISMCTVPSENSLVCGYVIDSLTGDFINGTEISLNWYDDLGHYNYNDTLSDSNGFYVFNVAAGRIRLNFYADGYFNKHTEYYYIEENETLWINISMDPRPQEKSTVCGYISDSYTGEPINDTDVDLYWKDDEGHSYWKYNYTNSSGYYLINIAAGRIRLNIDADGYFDEHTDWYFIQENETLWINISMDPIPPENSVVCGYINDGITEEPIDYADVNLHWWGLGGNSYWNDTYSNSDGYYAMNVAAGEIDVNVHKTGYFSNYTDLYYIEENVTLWVNFSMIPYPPENSVVCGYIIDSITEEPIYDADVDLRWNDEEHSYWNYTYTDSDGYYIMNVAAGNIKIYSYADGYFYNYSLSYEIEENETLWVNISMDPYPQENSLVCGYVIDSVSGEPIDDADVNIEWEDYEGHSKWNDTYSNSDGYYAINVAAGEIKLNIYADEYFYYYSEWYQIGENETLWINISLDPRPPENSKVCGYITDTLTGFPIRNADVELEWKDDEGHSVWNDDYSNYNGYYEISVASGEIQLTVYAEQYYTYQTEWLEILENEILWVNIPLYPTYNDPPEEPNITGEANGKAGKDYDYTFVANDPDFNQIRFFIDWGDNTSEWTDYQNPGEELIINHTWVEKGTYLVKAKTQDIHMAESNWSTLEVTMPLSSYNLETESNQKIKQNSKINQEIQKKQILLNTEQ